MTKGESGKHYKFPDTDRLSTDPFNDHITDVAVMDAATLRGKYAQALRLLDIMFKQRAEQAEAKLRTAESELAALQTRYEDAEGIIDFNLKEWRRDVDQRNAELDSLKEQLSNPTHHSFVMDVGVACLGCPRTAGMDEMTGWVFTTDTGWVCPSCRAKWDGR